MAAPSVTLAYLTKYERARVLGLRELQLRSEHDAESARAIALDELEGGKCKAVIRRYLPNGAHEDVAVASLILPWRRGTA